MEHVVLPPPGVGDGRPLDERVVDQIGLKVNKGGAAYADGKTLVVFVEGGDVEWHPNRVAKMLPHPLHFDTVWVVGLQRVENGEYIYGVTNLDLSNGPAPIWLVTVSADFTSWRVERTQ